MKRAIYITSEGHVLFTLQPSKDKCGGYVIALPPIEDDASKSFTKTNNLLRLFFGLRVDREEFPYNHELTTYPVINQMDDIYRIIPVSIADKIESKYPFIWFNKNDIRKLRESNSKILKDNYHLISDVFNALT